MNADHDDEPSFIPGVYMMSTREAIEAGFISYDKPTTPTIGECYECGTTLVGPLCPKCSSPAIGDVEKLIERLKAECFCEAKRLTVCCCCDAAAMLRSLAAERDQYAALYMDRCKKWSALRDENLKQSAAVAEKLDELQELDALRAEWARLNSVIDELIAEVSQCQAEKAKE